MNILSYNLSSDIIAFSTKREGGKSIGSYSSLNINPFVGDNENTVQENKIILSKELNIDANNIILPHQTHSVEVRQIGNESLSISNDIQKMLLEGVDALITNVPNVCIGVSTADYVPIIFYDPTHKAIGVAHAGWKGTVGGIAVKTLEKMHFAFGTNEKEVKVLICPAISFEAFEVGEDVALQFQNLTISNDKNIICESNVFKPLNKNNIVVDHSKESEEKKWHVNLPLCNQVMLENIGVLKTNIEQSNICTYTNNNVFFSARKLGTQSGRIYTGAIIK